jgi:phage head maturation protease
LLERGKVDGLSFGYRVREAKSVGGLRELIALDLVEVSLVAQPMQKLARVHAVETG